MTRRTALVGVIKRYRMAWAVFTVVLYVGAIPFTVIVFPANSLWLAVIILFSGFTSSMVTLADLLVNAEEAQVKETSDSG